MPSSFMYNQFSRMLVVADTGAVQSLKKTVLRTDKEEKRAEATSFGPNTTSLSL